MQHDTSTKILIVDDEIFVCELLSRWLTREGYLCETADSGDSALRKLEQSEFHLVISDIMMPKMSGIDLLKIIGEKYPDVAVIMATAVDDRKTAVSLVEMGAYGYLIKPFERNEILINVVNALERRRQCILSRQYEHSLELTILERTREIREREQEILIKLVAATGFRDNETGAHIKRIGEFAAEMAAALGWKSDDVENIRLAAPMHDIGKIGIPDKVLLKPGGLTPEEFDVIKQHTVIGAEILGSSSVPLLKMARNIALYHHERWDGSGYPYGLKGNDIPQEAAIVAVVDVYDALVNKRIYRDAFPEEQVLAMLIAGNGEHYGPEIFDCFLKLLPVFRDIRKNMSDDQ